MPGCLQTLIPNVFQSSLMYSCSVLPIEIVDIYISIIIMVLPQGYEYLMSCNKF